MQVHTHVTKQPVQRSGGRMSAIDWRFEESTVIQVTRPTGCDLQSARLHSHEASRTLTADAKSERRLVIEDRCRLNWRIGLCSEDCR